MKKVREYFGGKRYFYLVLAVVAAAAFLRLYKLPEYATFLGDQGRDAIIMKDIITFQNFTALGPITSVGSVYLGPFYYYLMAPWLGLFGLNPVGPAYGVAIISIICVALQYLAVKDLTDRTTALISIVFTTFSWVLVEFSRFSWNPNLLAPVSFFTVYAAIKAVQTHRALWYFLMGALLACAVQLHYLALFLIPFAGITTFFSFIKSKKNRLSVKLRNLFVLMSGFALTLAPFILFELKHGFPNMQSVIRFVTENSSKDASSNRIGELLDTSGKLLSYTFQMNVSTYGNILALIILILLGGVVWVTYRGKSKRNNSMLLVAAAVYTLLIGTSLYHGSKFPHYLGGLYILFYVLTAYSVRLMAQYVGTRYSALPVGVLLLGFIVLNGKHFIFLWQQQGPRQIDRARQVSQAVLHMNPRLPFTFTSSPEAYADYPFRYFLEAWNRKPVPKEQDTYIQTKDLIVLCEKKCDPMKDSQWAIAHFNPKKIADEKAEDGIYIYRLTK